MSASKIIGVRPADENHQVVLVEHPGRTALRGGSAAVMAIGDGLIEGLPIHAGDPHSDR